MSRSSAPKIVPGDPCEIPIEWWLERCHSALRIVYIILYLGSSATVSEGSGADSIQIDLRGLIKAPPGSRGVSILPSNPRDLVLLQLIQLRNPKRKLGLHASRSVAGEYD